MLETLQDIKNSTEYTEVNKQLNKIEKNLKFSIEAFDNGSIDKDRFVSKLMKLLKELSSITSEHETLIDFCTKLNKQADKLYSDIEYQLNHYSYETLLDL